MKCKACNNTFTADPQADFTAICDRCRPYVPQMRLAVFETEAALQMADDALSKRSGVTIAEARHAVRVVKLLYWS